MNKFTTLSKRNNFIDIERSGGSVGRIGCNQRNKSNISFKDMSVEENYATIVNHRSLTPYARENSNLKLKHKNDSSNIDRIFNEQEETLYHN